jgi:hypothetical protein
MLGRAAIVMGWDSPREMQAEIEDRHEHFAERLGIPGFLRGSRWIGRARRTLSPRLFRRPEGLPLITC